MGKRRFLMASAVLACTACLGDQGKLEIRSVDRGIKASQPVPYRIAAARGHLALGNVALALEGFRKAARDDPASMEALAGIADCYDRMGRFDLSRRYYEEALALAPREPALLAAFAASLDRQGLAAEAAGVRSEIAALAAAEPAAPAPVGASVTIALPPARAVDQPPPATAAASPQVVAVAAPPQVVAVAPVGQSVTIALPPARPHTAPAPTVRPAERAPRLERLSLSEVALITGSGPRWKRVEPPAKRLASARSDELRLLNAARVSRLAARTRSYLHGLGWNKVAIGDAAVTRASSLIVYPQGRSAQARRLAARLGFATAQRPGVRQVTVLLGRDASSHPALRPRA